MPFLLPFLSLISSSFFFSFYFLNHSFISSSFLPLATHHSCRSLSVRISRASSPSPQIPSLSPSAASITFLSHFPLPFIPCLFSLPSILLSLVPSLPLCHLFLFFTFLPMPLLLLSRVSLFSTTLPPLLSSHLPPFSLSLSAFPHTDHNKRNTGNQVLLRAAFVCFLVSLSNKSHVISPVKHYHPTSSLSPHPYLPLLLSLRILPSLPPSLPHSSLPANSYLFVCFCLCLWLSRDAADGL